MLMIMEKGRLVGATVDSPENVLRMTRLRLDRTRKKVPLIVGYVYGKI